MFEIGEIWAYPTDTSFGLGVRADDEKGLQKLADLKGRESTKYFSLMVRDMEMLRYFADVPEEVGEEFFYEKPRTVILHPKETLPESQFWPRDKVAFRVSTHSKVAQEIKFPITATSANLSGQEALFDVRQIKEVWGEKVKIFSECEKLEKQAPSEIWDFTEQPPQRLR